jgi:hypothetical protein
MASIKGNAILGDLGSIPGGLQVVHTLREEVELEKFVRVEVVCDAPRACASVVELQVSPAGGSKLLPLGNVGSRNVLCGDMLDDEDSSDQIVCLLCT